MRTSTKLPRPLALVLCLVSGLAIQAQDYVDRVLEDAPIAYYRFEEAVGEAVTDSSGNGFDEVTSTNTLLGATGVVGGAVEFFGDGALEVAFGMNPADSEGDGIGVGLDAFSVELFIRPKSLPVPVVAQIILAQVDGAGLGRSIILLTANGYLGTYLGGGTSDSTVTPWLDAWHHLVMTYDGGVSAEPFRFYVNGEYSGSSTRIPESATGNWIIGSHKNRNMQFFTGLLDEIAVYDYRLDDPDGDNDTSDSRIPIHVEAAFGPALPCNGLTLSCTVEDETVLAEVALVPQACECEELEILVDGVLVDSAAFPGDGLLEIPVPEDCISQTDRVLTLRCGSDGRATSCTFTCPEDPCNVLSLTAEVTDDDPPVLRAQIEPLAESCGCSELDLSIDGTLVQATATPIDGVIEIPLPEGCSPGSEHTLEVACSGGGPAESAYFRCPPDEAAFVEVILGDDPRVYYRFEESETDTVVTDFTGNGHDSLAIHNATLGVEGAIGKGVEFFGNGSIELNLQIDPADSEGDGVGVGLDDFTIEAIMKTRSAGTEQIFAAQTDGLGTGRSALLVTLNRTVGTFLGGATIDSSVAPEVERWYHVVMTYDGGGDTATIRLYVNGELAGSSTRVIESATGNWVLGAHKLQDRQFFTGILDEVAVYDYRLDDPDGDNGTSDSRVLAHYEAGFGSTPKCDSLDLTCSVTETDTIQMDVAVAPMGCPCATLDLFIDDLPAGSIDFPANGMAELPVPVGLPAGEHTLAVVCSSSGVSGTCTFSYGVVVGTTFLRGDSNADGDINITDGIFTLNYLFLGGPTPPCLDSADPNDDNEINITDGIYILNYLFLGGPSPEVPHPGCGVEAEGGADGLSCDAFPGCPQ